MSTKRTRASSVETKRANLMSNMAPPSSRVRCQIDKAAVNDPRRVIEIRHRVDHSKQFDDEVDAVERTKCVAYGSKKSESNEASAPVRPAR